MLQKLLEEDFDGFWHAVDPRELRLTSELFSQYPEDRFISNLKNLKQGIGKEKSAVAFDQTAFLHDRQLFPKAEMSLCGYKR
jgi:hypothetical protein